MNRAGTRALVMACIVATFVAAGCSKKVEVQTDQGKVTVDQGAGGTTTVKSDKGQVTVGKGAVDVAALGLPVYPGASQSDNAMSVSNGQHGEGGAFVVMTTTDPFDKVYEYYKGQLPAGSEKLKVSSGGTQMATFQVGADKDQKVVQLQESDGKVTITMTHQTKQ